MGELVSKRKVLQIIKKYWIRNFDLGYVNKIYDEVKELPCEDYKEEVFKAIDKSWIQGTSLLQADRLLEEVKKIPEEDEVER